MVSLSLAETLSVRKIVVQSYALLQPRDMLCDLL